MRRTSRTRGRIVPAAALLTVTLVVCVGRAARADDLLEDLDPSSEDFVEVADRRLVKLANEWRKEWLTTGTPKLRPPDEPEPEEARKARWQLQRQATSIVRAIRTLRAEAERRARDRARTRRGQDGIWGPWCVAGDGSAVAAGDPAGNVVVWDPDSSRPRLTLEADGGLLYSITVNTQRGRVFALTEDEKLFEWSLADGQATPPSSMPPFGLVTRGRSGAENQLDDLLLELHPRKPSFVVGHPEFRPRTAALRTSPDGRLLAVSWPGKPLCLYDVSSSERLRTLYEPDMRGCFGRRSVTLLVAPLRDILPELRSWSAPRRLEPKKAWLQETKWTWDCEETHPPEKGGEYHAWLIDIERIEGPQSIAVLLEWTAYPGGIRLEDARYRSHELCILRERDAVERARIRLDEPGPLRLLSAPACDRAVLASDSEILLVEPKRDGAVERVPIPEGRRVGAILPDGSAWFDVDDSGALVRVPTIPDTSPEPGGSDGDR